MSVVRRHVRFRDGSPEKPRLCVGSKPAEILHQRAEEAGDHGSAKAVGELLVRFVATCSQTRTGQDLRVVGSIGALGDWSPHSHSAVALSTSAEEFPTWRSGWISVPFDPRGFEYKYVVIGPDGFACWEETPNRRLPPADSRDRERAGTCRLTVEDAFGEDGSRSAHREWEDPAPERTQRLSGPLPELPKEVQQSLPARKSIDRAASFALVQQAADMASRGSLRVRRTKTIGCTQELPEGLVPTKRSLQQSSGAEPIELLREVTIAEMAETEAFGSDSSDSETTAPSETLTTNSSPCSEREGGGWSATPSSSDDHELKVEEPEVEIQRPEAFEDAYDLGGKVGEGAFGVVYRCFPKGGGPDRAVKVVKKDHLPGHALQALLGDEATGKEGEISLHSSLPPHEHIVVLYAFFLEPQRVQLVMDMCQGGDLFDAIGKARLKNRALGKDQGMAEAAAASATRQVLCALAFCHEHGVVHRDVKAENVLLKDPEEEAPLEGGRAVVMLCDFGLSARCWAADGPKLRDPVGSPDYVAPEVVRREAYGPAVDVWSSGVLLFASLRGRCPFPAKTDCEALALVKKGQVVYDGGWSQLAPEAKACTEHLLRASPAERPTAERAQEHPFLCRPFPG